MLLAACFWLLLDDAAGDAGDADDDDDDDDDNDDDVDNDDDEERILLAFPVIVIVIVIVGAQPVSAYQIMDALPSAILCYSVLFDSTIFSFSIFLCVCLFESQFPPTGLAYPIHAIPTLHLPPSEFPIRPFL